MRGRVGGAGLAYKDNVKDLFTGDNSEEQRQYERQVRLQQQRYAEELQAQIRHKQEAARQLYTENATNESTTLTLDTSSKQDLPDQDLGISQRSDNDGALLAYWPPTVNGAELRKQKLADAMAGKGQGLVFGKGYGGGSGPLRNPETGNVITDLNELKRFPSDPPGPTAQGRPVQTKTSSYPGAIPQAARATWQQKQQQRPGPYDGGGDVAEKQRQQLAFRTALEEQIQEKKRLKEAEQQRLREEAAAEEARLARERDRLRQQFEEERAPRKTAADKDTLDKGASKASETMEGDGVVIKFKRRPSHPSVAAPHKQMSQPGRRGSNTEPPTQPKDSIDNEAYSIPEPAFDDNSVGPGDGRTVGPSTSGHGGTGGGYKKAVVSSQEEQEMAAVKGALQEQLSEIKLLKEQAFESERRSIQVLRDLMDLSRSKLAAALTAQELPPGIGPAAYFPPQAVSSAYHLPAGLQTVAIGLQQLIPSRIPILMTSSTLRLEDSRPSTSQGIVQHSTAPSVPVLHSMVSRLRNTSLHEEHHPAPSSAAHPQPKAPAPPPPSEPQSAAVSSAASGSGPSHDTTPASNKVLVRKSKWRGSRLWPFSRVEKSPDGLWAWDEQPIKPAKKED